jgi:thioredoxin reductase (NADPH)
MLTSENGSKSKKIKIYGDVDSPGVYLIRDFLRRSVIEFELVDVESRKFSKARGKIKGHAVAVEFPDGTLLLDPAIPEIAKLLGWITQPKYPEYDLSIYGAGPAGLSAAVYAASEGLKTILIEKEAIGGQAGTSSLIENYMGFPTGISGAELAERGREQAVKFGVEILLLREGVKGKFDNNRIYVNLTNGQQIIAKTNICATGVEYTKLGLNDEAKFLNKGIYYGAGASEACFCGGKDIFIIGGGNSAGQAVVYFSGFASKVYMVIRKGNLSDTLSHYLINRISKIANVVILYHSELTAIEGDGQLRRVKITNTQTNTGTWYESSKVFICIGGEPNTDWAADTSIIRSPPGYLITGADLLGMQGFKDSWEPDRLPFHLETSVPGCFAAGDVRFNSVKRVASAVGEGAMAVTFVHQYLTAIK